MCRSELQRNGFAFVGGEAMRASLGELADWDAFAASWNDLVVDPYLVGRYRKRRHARFAVGDAIVREPHGPHYQSIDYNPLHGGIERWFEPIVGEPHSLTTVLAWGRDMFASVSGIRAWDVEAHQFRIEAIGDASPTPEGVHRDGVDYVLVLLVQRTNIRSGTTTIHDASGAVLGSFTLTAPFDAALVDDARLSHGVTPVEPIDPTQPAYRDVLVVTFKRTAHQAAS